MGFVYLGVIVAFTIGFRFLGDASWTSAVFFALLATAVCWATFETWTPPFAALLELWRHRHDKS